MLNIRGLKWFFEDSKVAYKTAKFYPKWPVRSIGQKQISLSRKNNMLHCTYVCKVGIAISLEQFSSPFFKVIFSYAVELSSKLFHCISFWLSVPINLPFSCDTTFPLCSGFLYGIPVKFTFSLAARSSEHEERRLAARGLSGIRLNLLGLNESRTSGLSLS